MLAPTSLDPYLIIDHNEDVRMIKSIPEQYRYLLALTAWAVVFILIMNKTAFGVEEGGAKTLLITWSFYQGIISPIVMGIPDGRALLYLPVGIYWTGSVVAAKVFSLIVLAAAVSFIFHWARNRWNQETALLACGLLLINPISFQQIDQLGTGAFLLFIFFASQYADEKYRAKPNAFGGYYFLQMFFCAMAVSMHPAGLAYPIALAMRWQQDPVSEQQKKYFFYGLAITSVLVIVSLRWAQLDWLSSPFYSLSSALHGVEINGDMSAARWFTASLLIAALGYVYLRNVKSYWPDLNMRCLLLSLPLGLLAADLAWALLAISLLLLLGLNQLIQWNSQFVSQTLFSKRGLVLVVVFVFSLSAMISGKKEYIQHDKQILSNIDQMFFDLAQLSNKAEELEKEELAPRVASQWPGRTMIACRCYVLPLPPATEKAEDQIKIMGDLTHLVFDYNDKNNAGLKANIGLLGGRFETVMRHVDGVSLRIRKFADESSVEKQNEKDSTNLSQTAE